MQAGNPCPSLEGSLKGQGRLAGKVIFVAGAGGIGSGLAKRYAREGASVVVGDLRLSSATEVVDEITREGGAAIAMYLDGSDEASVAEAMSGCVQLYGGLDGLHVNFAHLGDSDPRYSVVDLPLQIYDDVQRVNARGFVVCTRLAVPHLIARGGGSVVYTSSAAAYNSGIGQLAYAMSKAAGQALMRHVAKRFGSDGVRANTIAPALTLHAGIEGLVPPQMIEGAKAMAAIKDRVGKPEDIAAMGVLLMSDEGSYITGQIINVDGGTIMRA